MALGIECWQEAWVQFAHELLVQVQIRLDALAEAGISGTHAQEDEGILLLLLPILRLLQSIRRVQQRKRSKHEFWITQGLIALAQ